MTRRWNSAEFTTNDRKAVFVKVNGDFENGKVLYIERDWTMEELTSAAGQRLELPAAKRIFSADGIEIDDCMMIEDDDHIFVSDGSDFIAPAVELADGVVADSQDNLPPAVGGFLVGKFLGKGGFGEVRLGEHQVTGDKVALKFLRKAEILNIVAAERTTTEIQCLTTLKHQNIIRLEQHVESPLHFILVFELMEGGDLLKYMIKRGGKDKMYAISEDEARMLFYQLLSAIAYAHNQHICHRDLKLENILLKGEDLAHVKIADFGLSDFYRPGIAMKSNCGTLSFLAPEVFKGTSNAGPPLDVWSLGVILFAVLCGRLPFDGPDMKPTNRSSRPRESLIRSRIMNCQYKIDESIGPEVKDLIRRMLKVDPGERMSVSEVLNHPWLRSSAFLFTSFQQPEAISKKEAFSSPMSKTASDSSIAVDEIQSCSRQNSAESTSSKIEIDVLDSSDIGEVGDASISDLSVGPPVPRSPHPVSSHTTPPLEAVASPSFSGRSSTIKLERLRKSNVSDGGDQGIINQFNDGFNITRPRTVHSNMKLGLYKDEYANGNTSSLTKKSSSSNTGTETIAPVSSPSVDSKRLSSDGVIRNRSMNTLLGTAGSESLRVRSYTESEKGGKGLARAKTYF